MAEIEKIVVEPTYVLRLSATEAEELLTTLGGVTSSCDVYDALYEALDG